MNKPPHSAIQRTVALSIWYAVVLVDRTQTITLIAPCNEKNWDYRQHSFSGTTTVFDDKFLDDRTNGRAYATVLCLSVVCRRL